MTIITEQVQFLHRAIARLRDDIARAETYSGHIRPGSVERSCRRLDRLHDEVERMGGFVP